jgi:hypothetical protein
MWTLAPASVLTPASADAVISQSYNAAWVVAEAAGSLPPLGRLE